MSGYMLGFDWRKAEIQALYDAADELRWHADTNPNSNSGQTRKALRLADAIDAVVGRHGTGLTREGWNQLHKKKEEVKIGPRPAHHPNDPEYLTESDEVDIDE